ncbi:hypothetical protein M407DRAFT_231739 [Tulasnella calospora MUT 4182]|uniref:PH domain-containing protein n=1 Tax=Tulasnella calospora MUT 4182 TaxID=1051891 RepID=A0A0C3QVH5_9AGAM|nr:hypothetical protein M407DRAFT_231739 [Tulasnella calospora MUT 4182]
MVSASAFVSSIQHPTDGNICQGWLLKKRRKKMQGYAKRYFVLSSQGVISYSFEPGAPIRDEITLKLASITSSSNDKAIHIDSATATFHLKALGPTDYALWMSALRRFCAVASNPAVDDPTVTPRSQRASMSHSRSLTGSWIGVPANARALRVANDMESVGSSLPDCSRSDINVPKLVQTMKELEASTSTAVPSQIINSPLARVSEMVAFDNKSHRHSIGTIDSLSPSLWFDAEDGAEEFFLSAEPTETEQALSDPGDESEEEVVDITASDSSGDEAPTPTKERSEDGDSKHKVVIRRTKLPSPMVGDDGSLLAVLRKNVGKDLSTVSFPVSFNEPISILQKMAEDLEYFDLLGLAAVSADPIERICLVAAFAVSGYSCTLHRASRKPFNPMLGETFEDSRMNYISEKVSHHPAVMACHASGQGWEYWATSAAESKFWGRSMEIKNKGTTHVKLAGSYYTWYKPSSFVRNLLVGEKYLAHEGELIVKDSTSGHRCVITFKEGGYWGPSRAVSGAVYGPSSSTVLAKLDGTWNEGISLQLDSKGSHLRVLWRAHSFPPHAHEYYGFTSFAMSLNEITPDIEGRLCPTDSRLRPDQRAMEEGRMDFADDEKARLEGAQRERRKAREDRGEKWVPKWFEPHPTETDEWVYKGGYWEARAAKKWGKLEQLW